MMAVVFAVTANPADFWPFLKVNASNSPTGIRRSAIRPGRSRTGSANRRGHLAIIRPISFFLRLFPPSPSVVEIARRRNTSRRWFAGMSGISKRFFSWEKSMLDTIRNPRFVPLGPRRSVDVAATP